MHSPASVLQRNYTSLPEKSCDRVQTSSAGHEVLDAGLVRDLHRDNAPTAGHQSSHVNNTPLHPGQSSQRLVRDVAMLFSQNPTLGMRSEV